MKKIAILIQGPHSRNLFGSNTIDIIKKIKSLSDIREKFYLVAAIWEDEPQDIKDEIAALVDKVVEAKPPAYWGAGNRNVQVQGVSQGLAGINEDDFDYVLKTRSDIELSEKFLRLIVALAENSFKKLLAINVFTRFENYHISDLMLFSTFDNIKAYFDPSVYVHYEDLYSPEVQFARMFVRNKKLNYSFRLDDYLAFIRDWVEIIDFNEYELIWYKDKNLKVKNYNKFSGIIFDRDCGPVLTQVITPKTFNFIKNTRIPLFYVASFLLLADVIKRTYIYTLMKLFKQNFNHHLYFLDPYGAEFSKPVFDKFENQSTDFFENICKNIDIQSYIDKLAAKLKDKKVLIYGAGKFSKTIFQLYDMSKFNIIGISDKKFGAKQDSNQKFMGYQAYSPQYIQNLDYDEVVILTLGAIDLKENILTKELKIKNSKCHKLFCYQDLVRGLNFP